MARPLSFAIALVILVAPARVAPAARAPLCTADTVATFTRLAALAAHDDWARAERQLDEIGRAEPSCVPITIAHRALQAWISARVAAPLGGSPESLARPRTLRDAVRAIEGSSQFPVLVGYAQSVIDAAIAAAQDERAEMHLQLGHARGLSGQLAGAAYPALWPVPIDRAEGELAYEVDLYADALTAFQRLARSDAPGSAVWFWIARSAARQGDRSLACENYRKWSRESDRARDPARESEAADYLAGCP